MENKSDLCLTWNCEYDSNFIALLEQALNIKNLSLLQVNLENIEAFIQSQMNELSTINVFWNRTYGSEEEFKSLVPWAEEKAIYNINPYDASVLAIDKSRMHYILIRAGIYTPYTMVLPSFKDQPKIFVPDLTPLKDNFIIKPARGGGGDGVVMAANSMNEIILARQEYPDDNYLLQAHIDPVLLDERPAWFRVIYCLGNVYPCWWHPDTHIYTPVSVYEEEKFKLSPLRRIAQQLSALTSLNFFSTEIAITYDGHFTVIDYINDEIDLRLKSYAIDGVPDEIITDIIERIVRLVDHYRQEELHPVYLTSLQL